MKAESYVYESRTGGPGYVGRHPRGDMKLVARPGQEVDAETMARLGLTDLEDHTDYDTIGVEAREAGAAVTVADTKGPSSVKSVIRKANA